MEEYPSLDIRVTEMKTQECLEALKAGELEAVLIAGAAEGPISTPYPFIMNLF